ncbi:5-methylcytosine-specific restriction enzyme subunit McrC [Caldalkalibacillus uzonensis]|uniref:5-methylcytosine-specific restriction enzyme subunit McrC n=1 Tax=Caldalkalibacillus uzonensis TaxID=353224 RepID=A0ABU0CVT1_9BACI|nr:hypothetical protein [Caldalkalibacillus uzonensis]MDQ0340526.1 5-methylcytosine-specific restriction enzyme subunit McrC [Caldalkalibacillus uzonensis]
MKQICYLSEYSELHVAGYRLSIAERDYLSRLSATANGQNQEVKLYFDELRTGVRFRSTSWVGVIELEGVRLVITPKFNKGFQSLIDMICFVEQLPFHQWDETEAEWGRHQLMELFVRLYLIELEKLMEIGIVKEYVTEEDNLTRLRGRPDFMKQLQHNFALAHRLYCRYDELATNIPENQVILKGLTLAQQLDLYPATQKKVHQYRTEWEQWCEPYRGEQLPPFHYHRLNAHYEKVHKLTSYLFKSMAVNNLYRFEESAYYSLLIDMNELFERFVVGLLKQYLPARYKVTASKRITTAIMADGSSYRHIIPDMIVTDQETGDHSVLDTKYKNYGERKVETADIFQLNFYAQYFHHHIEKPHRAIIVYPKFSGVNTQPLQIRLLPDTFHQGVLAVKPIGIEECLTDIKDREVKKLERKVWTLVD